MTEGIPPLSAERLEQLERKIDNLTNVANRANPLHPEVQTRELVVREVVRQALENDEKETSQRKRRRRKFMLGASLLAAVAALGYWRNEAIQKLGMESEVSQIRERVQRAYLALAGEDSPQTLTADQKRTFLRKKYEEKIWKLYNIGGKDVSELGKLRDEIEACKEPEMLDLIYRIRDIIQEREKENQPDMAKKKTDAETEKKQDYNKLADQKSDRTNPLTMPLKNDQREEKDQKTPIPPIVETQEKKKEAETSRKPTARLQPQMEALWQRAKDLEVLWKRANTGELLTTAEVDLLQQEFEQEKEDWWKNSFQPTSASKRKELREKTIRERKELERAIETERSVLQLTRIGKPGTATTEETRKKEEEWSTRLKQFEVLTHQAERNLEESIGLEQREATKNFEEKQRRIHTLRSKIKKP